MIKNLTKTSKLQKPNIEDIVLQVDALGKCFKIYENPWHRALEWANFGKRTHHQPFHALQDISFEVKRGEFLGIIGQNGAGKSTLLKILSGVLEPSSGSCRVNGKILPMLELGMDFNLYLNGRENAVRSAELLGFPDGYVQERMEQILDFSELGNFFDRPVRLYSSGMTARLAFSLFAFLDCDILILDEVLAVGDLFFRQKCYARLEELIAKNTTIIFVTHNMESVRQYCNHVVLLEKGREVYQGEAQQAIHKYYQLKHGWGTTETTALELKDVSEEDEFPNEFISWPDEAIFNALPPSEKELAQLTGFAVCNSRGEACLNFTQGERAYFYFEFSLQEDIGVPISMITLTNQFKVMIHGKLSFQYQNSVPRQVREEEQLRICQCLTLSLAPGEYVLGCDLFTTHPNDYALRNELSLEELRSKSIWLSRREQVAYVIVAPLDTIRQKPSHLGLCDLPGECRMQVVTAQPF